MPAVGVFQLVALVQFIKAILKYSIDEQTFFDAMDREFWLFQPGGGGRGHF